MKPLRLVLPTLALCIGAAALSAQTGPRRVFVSSAFGPGDFDTWSQATPGTSGIDAADSVCANLATAAALPNAAGFRAWLSDSQDDAWCRVQGRTGRRDTGCGGAPDLPGAGPWARRDGVRWAGSLAQLTGEIGPLVPLDRDERGLLVAEWTSYWTGTDGAGRAAAGGTGLSCGDWNSISGTASGSQGSAGGTRFAWTEQFLATCANHHRIVCLETGPAGAVPPVASLGPAALAFITTATGHADLGSWPAAAGLFGLEAGDQICRSEAIAARLPQPESFVVWLSTSTVDARMRLPTGIGWARIDGVGIATGRADLVDGRLAAPINLSANRVYLPLSPSDEGLAWSGTAFDGTGLPGFSCGDWTSTTDSGLAGEIPQSSAAWTDGRPADCADALPIYCLSTVEILFWDPFETGDVTRWSQVQI